MSTFGDYRNDDALDTEPADAEQVAMLLHKYRQEDEPNVVCWDDLSDPGKRMLVARVTKLLALLRRQGAMK